MANYGAKDLVITLTDAGAVARDISANVRSINGIEVDPSTEPSHGFSAQWAAALYTGFASMAPITLSGIYDDAAQKVDALYTRGATRTLVVTYGGAKTTTVSVVLGKYVRKPISEKATQYELTLIPTGTPVEA